MLVTIEEAGILWNPSVRKAGGDVFIDVGRTADLPAVSEQNRRHFRTSDSVLIRSFCCKWGSLLQSCRLLLSLSSLQLVGLL